MAQQEAGPTLHRYASPGRTPERGPHALPISTSSSSASNARSGTSTVGLRDDDPGAAQQEAPELFLCLVPGVRPALSTQPHGCSTIFRLCILSEGSPRQCRLRLYYHKKETSTYSKVFSMKQPEILPRFNSEIKEKGTEFFKAAWPVSRVPPRKEHAEKVAVLFGETSRRTLARSEKPFHPQHLKTPLFFPVLRSESGERRRPAPATESSPMSDHRSAGKSCHDPGGT
ncbi:hypothetical protein NDU88_000466 [Pleurodeles waltl]|uniref:Uncharacterized protein n=1 Tax=Pleurodeles waltl TaxID=8319 RepID=A0AAV7L6L3_PLEWA|nr:hypothetical protein NDU88_000466 [Pleurodeles waltl]